MHSFHAPYGVYGNTASEWFELTENTKRVRRYLEDSFIEHGRGPNLAQIMRDLGLDQRTTWHSLHQLERGVQLMFVPGTETISKMPPFSNVPTRHRLTVDGESKWYVGCAGECCAVGGMFPGRTAIIDSFCPDCWEPIRFETKDLIVVALDPPTTVLHIGIHPNRFREEWNVTCDSINFFISAEHVAEWERAFPDKRGVIVPIKLGEAPPMGVEIARIRHWDYDRGPDPGGGQAMVERYRAMGLDVSAWE